MADWEVAPSSLLERCRGVFSSLRLQSGSWSWFGFFFFLRREERKFSLSPAPSPGAFNRSPVCHIPKKSKRCGMLSDSFWRNWR